MMKMLWPMRCIERINITVLNISMILIILGTWTRRSTLSACAIPLASFSWPRPSPIMLLAGILQSLLIFTFLHPDVVQSYGDIMATEHAPKWQVWLYRYALFNCALLTVFPSLVYLTFGLILHYQLVQNNNMLRTFLDNNSRSRVFNVVEIGTAEELFKICNTFMDVRQLYKKLVHSQSVGFLGIHISYLSMIFTCFCYILLNLELTGWGNYFILIFIMTIMTMALLLGHVADVIKDEVRLKFFFSLCTFSFHDDIPHHVDITSISHCILICVSN